MLKKSKNGTRRGLSHEEVEQVFIRGPRARSAYGAEAMLLQSPISCDALTMSRRQSSAARLAWLRQYRGS